MTTCYAILLGLTCCVLFMESGAVPPNIQVHKSGKVAQLTAKSTDTCLRAGGLCAPKSECPSDKLSSEKGLCGAGDVECCHAIPSSVKDCEERGGICRPSAKCGNGPRDPIGVCADQGSVCCVLVH